MTRVTKTYKSVQIYTVGHPSSHAPPDAQSGREKRRLRLGRPRESITPGTELNKADGGLDWRGGEQDPEGGCCLLMKSLPSPVLLAVRDGGKAPQ